ncbi:hypothetical protein LCGC14_2202610 [marine sediment metagenome]|uniref:NfeD1b N-terminal domain-containing protein n=1 Tax=marine sediment metagenome TaxID=412755 RepID=A0A0F9DGC6_9ZZZZ
MRLRALQATLAAAATLVLLLPAQAGTQTEVGPLVHSIDLDVTINPASAGWVSQALDDAEDAGAKLVIFRLDTPGGLDDSMREMVKDIIAAPMPVVMYVSPDGARAASAGLFITEAADVAAMAPRQTLAPPLRSRLAGASRTRCSVAR